MVDATSQEDHLFRGMLHEIAEKEFESSFDEDDDNECVNSLLKEYREAGSPKKQKQWIRERFKTLFISVDERPQWVEEPMWPFWDGKPMVFISQCTLPCNDVCKEFLSPEVVVLYTFGIRIPFGNGFEVKYRVVEQLPSLKGIVAIPR